MSDATCVTVRARPQDVVTTLRCAGLVVRARDQQVAVTLRCRS